MDILSLHWGNISVDIRIGDNVTNVYLKECIVIWEKQVFSCHLCVLAVEGAVCGVRRMCWIPYTTTHQPALVAFPSQKDDSQRAAWLLCVRISLIRSIYKQCRGCGRGRTTPSTVFSMGASHDCVYPSMSVPWRGMKGNVYATEVRVCDYVINRIKATAADIRPGQLPFVRGSDWHYCKACSDVGGGEDTSNSCCDYVQHIHSADNTRTGSRPLIKLKWRLKNATNGRIWFMSFQTRESTDILC
jgi:hypothetical protein